MGVLGNFEVKFVDFFVEFFNEFSAIFYESSWDLSSLGSAEGLNNYHKVLLKLWQRFGTYCFLFRAKSNRCTYNIF
jgi:hypothetical protein